MDGDRRMFPGHMETHCSLKHPLKKGPSSGFLCITLLCFLSDLHQQGFFFFFFLFISANIVVISR